MSYADFYMMMELDAPLSIKISLEVMVLTTFTKVLLLGD